MTNRPSTLVFVLGMHRSGTSALTGVLDMLGVNLGAKLMPANRYNARGYFENAGAYELNESILNDLGRSWHGIASLTGKEIAQLSSGPYPERIETLIKAIAGKHPITVIKDPRICLLWPVWFMAAAKAGFDIRIIITLRKPSAVAQSLLARDHQAPAKSGWLWITHTIGALSAASQRPAIVVDYEHLLQNTGGYISKVAEFLKLPATTEMTSKIIDQFVDPRMNHASDDSGFDPVSSGIPPLALDIYRRLHSAHEGRINPEEMAKDLAGWQQTAGDVQGLGWLIARQEKEIAAHLTSLAAARRDIDHINGINQLQQQEIVLMRESWSWRLTKPLRNAYHYMMKRKKR